VSVYKRTYKIKLPSGEVVQRQSDRWTVEVWDAKSRKAIRKTAGRDLKAAKAMELRLMVDIERGDAGLVDPHKEHRGVPWPKVVESFVRKLKTDNLDSMYVYTAEKRLLRLGMEAGWTTVFDATLRGFDEWRERAAQSGWRGRPTKAKTLNQHLSLAREFFRWCVDTGRMPENPLEKARKAKEDDASDYRRAATPDEVGRFLASLPDDSLRRFYIFMAFSAPRRASAAALTWDDFSLAGDDPYFIIPGRANKVGHAQRFALRLDVARMLAEARGDADGSEKVFPYVPTMRRHKTLLKRAGIRFHDENKRKRFDIHAFRKTLQSWLEDAGVDVREASKALGHKHLTTTLKSYREKKSARRQEGVERLPGLIG
jgi:integrase